jgi:hypothetical protein
VGVYSTDQTRRIKQRRQGAADASVGRIAWIGPFRRLTDKPIDGTRLVDQRVDLAAAGRVLPDEPLVDRPLPRDQVDDAGKPYRYRVFAYRVVAVNRLGVESGPSPLRFTYPSTVEHVFAREETDGRTRLRWQPSRENGVAGYLVYRHNGRWNTDPIVRLTPKPIPRTEFPDETAGDSTRRHEIVAVDALGQEGEPSRPVWSRREWGRFYVPYTGEWHQ